MILFLRSFFVLVLLSMLGVTAWAGMQVPIWAIPASVGGHPWFIATLFDTYWAFLTFFLWLCYKERSIPARLLWLLAILLLGNLAMASYMLVLLFRLPLSASLEQVVHKTSPVPTVIPVLLLAAFALVLGLGSLL